jgi:ABC-type transport system involved in multi-copper enzyme maturation permease subunit
MMAALKAELRKLFTVRSTYLLAAIAFALGALLIGLWIWGYKDVEHAALNQKALASMIMSTVSIAGIFLSFLAVLLVGHEYRYNTIMYSLTSSNSRSKVFFAKFVVLLVAALVIAGLITASAIGLFYLGQNLHHVTTVTQVVPVWDVVWRAVVTIVGDITFAFIISMLLRNLIGSIAVVLVLPSTVENLLSLLLKDNVKYLPYTALGNLSQNVTTVSHTFSLGVVAVYVAVAGIASWLLFLRRDAN